MTDVTSPDAGRKMPKQVLVRMPMPLYEAMKARADTEDRTMAQAVRHACRRYLAS